MKFLTSRFEEIFQIILGLFLVFLMSGCGNSCQRLMCSSETEFASEAAWEAEYEANGCFDQKVSCRGFED